jgi:hypothetical protein
MYGLCFRKKPGPLSRRVKPMEPQESSEVVQNVALGAEVGCGRGSANRDIVVLFLVSTLMRCSLIKSSLLY